MQAAGPTRWRVWAIVSVGVFMASLDLFIVNIAFPDVQRDFAGTSLADLSWILNAYAIVFAALLVPAGRISDRAGRKRGFLGGLALFVAASALCAAAPSPELLVAARVAAGRRRRLHGADVARPAAARVPARAARDRRRRVGRGRRRRRSGRTADRRSARRGELALGLPRQRARRAGHPLHRGARAARAPRARRHTAPRPPRSAAARGRDRPAQPRHRQGARLGLGEHARGRCLCGRRRPGPAVRPAFRAPSGARRGAADAAGALVRGRQPRSAAVLRVLLGDAARRSALPDRGVGVLRARGGPRARTRSADGGRVLVSLRQAQRPLRPAGHRRARRPDLRPRWRVVDLAGGSGAELRCRAASRHAPDRHRRRPHDSDPVECRRRIAAAEPFRDRHRRVRHVAPDRHRAGRVDPDRDPRHTRPGRRPRALRRRLDVHGGHRGGGRNCDCVAGHGCGHPRGVGTAGRRPSARAPSPGTTRSRRPRWATTCRGSTTCAQCATARFPRPRSRCCSA